MADAEREAEEKARVAQEAKEAASRKAHPSDYVGIWLEGDVTSYFKNVTAPDRERSIVIDRIRYEHTHEDADGVWMYRCLDRK